ncbi:MAG: ATP-binding cassette domain-containing protein [Hyphomicrobiales bacterium]
MAEQTADRTPPLLSTSGLTKTFSVSSPTIIDFAINRGEIHALLGENGAGKSTFVKMLYGGYVTAGEIRWKGDGASRSPARRRPGGSASAWFPALSLFDALTVAENIALALPGRLRPARLRHGSPKSRGTTACHSIRRTVVCRSLGRRAAAGRDRAASCRA